MSDDRYIDLLVNARLGVLATIKRDGRAQLSNINYVFDPETRQLRISITAKRAKYKNLKRDPRASVHVSAEDGWSYAVAEGVAELSPVAQDPHDATVEALVDLYRDVAGEHPDWDEYRASMVEDHRVLLTMAVSKFYGMV